MERSGGKTKAMKKKYREWIITGILGGMVAFMAVYGWQASMKYGTFLLQAEIWKRIGRLSGAGCVLAFAVLFPFFTVLFHFGYSRLSNRKKKEVHMEELATVASGRGDSVWLLPDPADLLLSGFL